jgi:thiamine-phosphate pyrophosphorylase
MMTEGNRESASSPPGEVATKAGVLRILDAEANRATEGLRVIEDHLRFILEDRNLTELARQMRHRLVTVLRPLEREGRLTARAADTDVGAMLATPEQSRREELADVAAASFKRVQQALRSLEEYVKLIDPGMAAEIEPLRFQIYTLERAVGITRDSLGRLADSRLYVLLDGCGSEAEFERLIRSLVSAGVHIIQLRDKRLADRELLGRAKRLRELTRDSHTLFIMNDRSDLAVLSSADGVHVGQEELSVKDARIVVGPKALVGVSTHSIEQARQAVIDGANYIGVGPTFPSTTKSFDAFAGLNFIRAVAAEITLPAFAIGGITRENLAQVQAAGINRVAISGAVIAAGDPAAAASEMMKVLKSRKGG